MPHHTEPLRTDQVQRFEARFATVDRSPLVATALVATLIGLAILKPWAAADMPSTGPQGADRGVAAATDAASPTSRLSPTPAPTSTGEAVIEQCHDPGSWRTATIETWRDQTVRVWRAIDPAAASGPLDPTIPIVPAVGNAIPAIGYCAPTSGPQQPVGQASIRAWRLDRGVAHPIDLRQVAPVRVTSPYGALFGPPAGLGSTGWPSGIVVLRYDELAADTQRWFAIEVTVTSSGDTAAPSPAASRTP